MQNTAQHNILLKPPPLNMAPYRNRQLILNVIHTGNKVRGLLKTQGNIFWSSILLPSYASNITNPIHCMNRIGPQKLILLQEEEQ